MPKRVIDDQAVFEAALDEFSQKSYEEASLNTIIKKAGLPKGSFYYRFATKYELYLYLLKESSQRKWAFINSELPIDAADLADKDIFDVFLIQADIAVRFAKAQPRYHQLGKRLSQEKGPELYAKVLNDLGLPDETGLSQRIEAAFNAGIFSPEYSKEFVHSLLKALFVSFDEIFFQHEQFDLQKSLAYLREFVLFLKRGLKA